MPSQAPSDSLVLSEKVELVKQVIINLANNVESGRDPWDWERIPLEDFYRRDEAVKAVSKGARCFGRTLIVTLY